MLPGSRYMFDRTTATRASMASFLPESRCTFDADAPRWSEVRIRTSMFDVRTSSPTSSSSYM
jgi:hypothetical protein